MTIVIVISMVRLAIEMNQNFPTSNFRYRRGLLHCVYAAGTTNCLQIKRIFDLSICYK